jgi:hypothetical protein
MMLLAAAAFAMLVAHAGRPPTIIVLSVVLSTILFAVPPYCWRAPHLFAAENAGTAHGHALL